MDKVMSRRRFAVGALGVGAALAAADLTAEAATQGARADTTTGYIPLPANPAEGQLLQWSSGLGAWIPVNPYGTSQLAYAENNSGIVQSGLTHGTATITACSISVPPSSRPVYLSAGCLIVPTALSATTAMQVQIAEVGNGVDTPATISKFVPFVTAQVKAGVDGGIVPVLLAASTARTRTFVLQVVVPTGCTITVENGAYNGRSFITAEAR